MRALLLCFSHIVFIVLPVGAQPGSLIHSPEALSGPWEAADGRGGYVGIFLQMLTAVPRRPTTLVGISQYEQHLGVSVYHRDLSAPDMDGNSFTDESAGGAVWNGRHLRIRSRPDFDLDLDWDKARSEWRGYVVRKSFHGNVVLKRPWIHSGPLSVTGTWASRFGSLTTCLHIAERKDHSLVAWSDSLRTVGLERYANGIVPATDATERYGQQEGIEMEPDGLLMITFGKYMAMCCMHSHFLRLAKDGTRMTVTPSVTKRESYYERMPRLSCVARSKQAP